MANTPRHVGVELHIKNPETPKVEIDLEALARTLKSTLGWEKPKIASEDYTISRFKTVAHGVKAGDFLLGDDGSRIKVRSVEVLHDPFNVTYHTDLGPIQPKTLTGKKIEVERRHELPLAPGTIVRFRDPNNAAWVSVVRRSENGKWMSVDGRIGIFYDEYVIRRIRDEIGEVTFDPRVEN